VWVDKEADDELDPDAVLLAEAVLKVGRELGAHWAHGRGPPEFLVFSATTVFRVFSNNRF
jgi:hypothetical protein